MEYQLLENSTINTSHNLIPALPTYTKCSSFFCIMSGTVPSLRRAKLARYFKQMPLRDDQEDILALSSIWKIAITKPNNPELPSLGIFKCMAKLIQKSVTHKDWLLRFQNIYIPYYAAHIIGSYAMNKPEFADKAVKSNVVQPLMELLQGKISWVEQRVALRALGHLASHEATFEAVAEHESEIIEAAINIASTCVNEVYEKFLGLKKSERLEYQRNLLTRRHGDLLELENKKAEEWTSQLQCWSLYLLDCFACKERSLGLICNKQFLKDLCEMWGGLSNPNLFSGIGLLRTLCHTQIGREKVAELHEVIVNLCNVSRSSDNQQHMAIDSLLQLLKDPVTRYKVIDTAAPVLADLVELRSIKGKPKIGQEIMQTLLKDFHKIKFCKLNLKSEKAKSTLEEVWDLKVDRVKRESLMSEEEIREKEVLASVLKKEGNKEFCSGEVEKAVVKYTEALDLCPLRDRKERIVLHSNRAQCYLLLRDPEAAISDSTRALCLSGVANLHANSLWRRSQAYDKKGLAKESLVDCLMYIRKRFGSKQRTGFKIPCYAARMANKQMNATWIFTSVKSSWHGIHGEVKEFMVQNQMGALNLRKKTGRTAKGTANREQSFNGRTARNRRKLERQV